MEYLIYQIKLSGLISIYYLIYRIIYFENRFQFKRIFLLISLLLAIIIPFIHINTHTHLLDNVQVNLPEVIVNVNSAVKGIRDTNNFWLLWFMLPFPLLYITQLFRQFLFIFKLKRNADVSYFGKYKIFNINSNDSFTFFDCLYIGGNIDTQNRNVIIQHELIHARKLHSIDILFIDFLILFQWYNPFIWFFKKAMRENHEFEVDSIVLHQGIEIHRYQNLLINALFRTTRFNFSSFKHSSLIKNRIKMMTKIPRAGKTRFLLATVLSLILIGSFAFTSEQLNSGVSNTFSGNSFNKQPKDTTVYMEVDEPATFMGKNLSEFNIYIAQHVKYPMEAVKSKFQGKVFVQFIVELNGKVDVVKVLRSSGYKILDEEALRVIKEAPSWVPGKKDNKVVRQSFTLPVVFALQ